VTAVLFTEPTPELEQWLAERRQFGLDRYDEEWDGVYIVNPGPGGLHQDVVLALINVLQPVAEARGLRLLPGANIGRDHRFRIPDVVVLDSFDQGVFFPTASVAVEVRSPGQRPDDKLPSYLELGVDEVVLVDPATRVVRWLASAGGTWAETTRSAVLDVDVADIVGTIRWPA
jgi:Uma2 family endonuclease